MSVGSNVRCKTIPMVTHCMKTFCSNQDALLCFVVSCQSLLCCHADGQPICEEVSFLLRRNDLHLQRDPRHQSHLKTSGLDLRIH